MDSFEENKKIIGTVMEEFIDACDEYLFCLVFSVQGIEQRGKELKKCDSEKASGYGLVPT
ncbi:hypothetical protein H0Z12_22715 (plasmid) [Pantoea ananatis]|uniref:Uncharacterized protein n=1 Tax=Pantoea ananas TaxID=553 RepID=A0A8A4KE69_PANAN|nr:hypothetical protein [Pantoea ananatis]QTC48407.1 hypothetical protein H0Z12_22715 [Pantoea ananatis]